MTGSRPYYYSYDMQTGKVTKSGTRLSGEENGGMEQFKFSPDGGMLAIGGKRGIVQLLDWKGTGIPLGQVKMNSALKGIAWSQGGEELLTLDQESQVYVWDIRTNRCIRRWRDEGGFGAIGLQVSNDDKFTAIAFVAFQSMSVSC